MSRRVKFSISKAAVGKPQMNINSLKMDLLLYHKKGRGKNFGNIQHEWRHVREGSSAAAKNIFKESFFSFLYAGAVKKLTSTQKWENGKSINPVRVHDDISFYSSQAKCMQISFLCYTNIAFSLTHLHSILHIWWRFFFGENSCCIEKRFCLRKLSLTTQRNYSEYRNKNGFKTLASNTIFKFKIFLMKNFVWNCYNNTTARCEKFQP